MMVRVKLFAAARELAGGDEVAVEVPDGATVADVRQALVGDSARAWNESCRTPAGPSTPSSLADDTIDYGEIRSRPDPTGERRLDRLLA